MFQIHTVGILALVAVAMCWALAMVLFRVGTPGSVARRLSLLMAFEGVTLISTGYIDLLLSPELQAHQFFPKWLMVEEILHTLGDCVMFALYPPFLAAALQTSLTRPFGSKQMQILLAVAALILFITVLTSPMWFGATLLYTLLSLLFGFALVASIHAWHIAKGAARNRARSFAFAFGIRDVCWGLAYSFAIGQIWFGEYHVVDPDASSAIYVVYALGTLLAVPLVAYGILRTQLFDIDLRIRWTIKQSTLAAVFVTLIYLLSEGADRILSEELGNFAGLLASAIVIFFLAPLQRFAEGVASLAMPNTRNTPEYAAFRKMQVYEAAVEEALQGGISEKERVLLNHLCDSLKISAIDAETLERDLLTSNVFGDKSHQNSPG
jgi:hypothetical protein